MQDRESARQSRFRAFTVRFEYEDKKESETMKRILNSASAHKRDVNSEMVYALQKHYGVSK